MTGLRFCAMLTFIITFRHFFVRPEWPQWQKILVLVTTQKNASRAAYVAFAKDRHMADIAMSSEVVVVAALPQLGAGKTDFMAVQAMVRDRASAVASADRSEPEPQVA